MKKGMAVAVLAGAALLAGCAGPYSGASVFNSYDAPSRVTDNAADCSKTGTSKMINVLNVVAVGDASVTAAKKSAGITKVANVDYNYLSFLGFFGVTTTKICGE